MVGLAGWVGQIYYFRWRVPQIGVEMLRRELEAHREELAASDRDRQELRKDLKVMRAQHDETAQLYRESVAEWQRDRHRLRQAELLLRERRVPIPWEREDES